MSAITLIVIIFYFSDSIHRFSNWRNEEITGKKCKENDHEEERREEERKSQELKEAMEETKRDETRRDEMRGDRELWAGKKGRLFSKKSRNEGTDNPSI